MLSSCYKSSETSSLGRHPTFAARSIDGIIQFNSAQYHLHIIFIVGIIAISIGLGIELKLVPVSNQVSRSGRIGAMALGTVLVFVSIGIYLRESSQAAAVTSATPQPALATNIPAQANIAGVSTPVPSALAELATAVPLLPTDIPPTATTLPPTLTPALPTATPVPVPGSVVRATGTIQDIAIKKKDSTVVVNGITYRLVSDLVEPLKQYLVVGALIVFDAEYGAKGEITITNITHINNQEVVLTDRDQKQGYVMR